MLVVTVESMKYAHFKIQVHEILKIWNIKNTSLWTMHRIDCLKWIPWYFSPYYNAFFHFCITSRFQPKKCVSALSFKNVNSSLNFCLTTSSKLSLEIGIRLLFHYISHHWSYMSPVKSQFNLSIQLYFLPLHIGNMFHHKIQHDLVFFLRIW